VKTKTISASSALVLANKGQTPNVEFPSDFQDLCSLAMDQAMGIEKASLTTVVRLNSSVIDIYKNAFWFAPVFGDLLDTAAKSFAFCIELQMNWLTMMMPHASSSESQAESPAEELAHSMDIAIGERDTTRSNTVMSISGSQAQPTAEVPERNMETAMRARAA
jgi:hypothetical protein